MALAFSLLHVSAGMLAGGGSGGVEVLEADINGQRWQATAVTLLVPEEAGTDRYVLVGGTFGHNHVPATALALSFFTTAQAGSYQLVSPELMFCNPQAWSWASGWFIRDLQNKPKVFDFISGRMQFTRCDHEKISGVFQCLAVYQNDPGAVLALENGRFEVILRSSSANPPRKGGG